MRFPSRVAKQRKSFVVNMLLNDSAALSNREVSRRMIDKFGSGGSDEWIMECREDADKRRMLKKDFVKDTKEVAKLVQKAKPLPKAKATNKHPAKRVLVTTGATPKAVEPPLPAYPPALKTSLEAMGAALRGSYTAATVAVRLLPDGKVVVQYELTPKAQNMRGEVSI